MTLKEIQAKTGSLPSYGLYFVVAFLWYLVDVVLFRTQLVFAEGPLQTFISAGFGLVITPLITAGLYGGIHLQQQNQDLSALRAFGTGVKLHYWRMILANLLYYVLFIIAAFSLTAATGSSQPEFFGIKLFELISIPFAALTLLWFSALVVERKLFHSLLTAVKLFLFNPYVLLLGVTWGTVRLADTRILDSALIKQAPFAIYIVPAGIYAVLRVLAMVYGLATYKQANGETVETAAEPETVSPTSGDGLAKTGFGFAFVAFLPLVHLVALVLGIMALRRKKQFVLKAAIACLAGGFFTIFYFLIAAGLLVRGVFPEQAPDYSFLSRANPSLKSQVALLEKGSFTQVRQQLEQVSSASAAQDWTVDSILAIASYNDGFSTEAFKYFQSAAAKKPDQGGFYFQYGLALLKHGEVEKAGEQFKAALKVQPDLAIAQKYSALVANAYYPPQVISSLLFVVILLVSFTVHEYGHAYSAWKLGDDTSKNLGRLTLNPVVHLDLFGSILLPGIMLLQQSGMVFGWAKPVPVDPRNFLNPRKDHMIVSFAGPATNLMLAMASFVLIGFLMLVVRLFWPETISLDLATPYHALSIVGPPFAKALVVIILFIKQIFYTSLTLGVLNLLPFPPLDGSWILAGMLPERFGAFFEKIRMFGSIIFLLLVLSPVLDYILAVPMGAAWGAFSVLFMSMGLG